MTAAEIPRLSCPQCRGELRAALLRDVQVSSCPSCKGTLIAQMDLPDLLEVLASEILLKFDPDARIPPSPGLDARESRCPRCEARMDSDDYCRAGVAAFDRCNPCQLLWFATDDIGPMTLMWARMNSRQARVRALNRQPWPMGGADELRALLGRDVADVLDTLMVIK